MTAYDAWLDAPLHATEAADLAYELIADEAGNRATWPMSDADNELAAELVNDNKWDDDAWEQLANLLTKIALGQPVSAQDTTLLLTEADIAGAIEDEIIGQNRREYS